jgi:hypothetical protein
MIASNQYRLRKRFLKAAKKNEQTGEEQPHMAALVPVYILTVRERFRGTPVLPDRPRFDFLVKMVACALDGWP